MWKRRLGSESIRMTDLLVTACLLLGLTAGITSRPVIFMLSGLLALYLLINSIYERALLKISLSNNKQTLRLFPEDKETLLFHFHNKTFFPFLNGTLRFNMDASVTIDQSFTRNQEHQFELPLALIGKGKTELEIPIRALQRGTAKIHNISYSFPHLFKFHPVTLAYLPFFQTEIIVYPRPLNVEGISQYSHTTPGIQRSRLSPFTDESERIGTREYQYTDPFKNINWKASAKLQQLQTNTYEMTIDKSVILIVNLQDKQLNSSPVANAILEKRLSYTACLAEHFRNEGSPYTLYINIRNPGPVPFQYLPEEAGNSQYMRTLEILARVHQYPMLVPAAQMLYRIGQEQFNPKTIIIIGDIFPEMHSIISRWKTNHQIMHVEELGDTAILTPFQKGRIEHAP